MINDHKILKFDANQRPTSFDVWQAASLLIGLLGADAVPYVGGRYSATSETDEPDVAKTWQRISCEVEHLLSTAPEME